MTDDEWSEDDIDSWSSDEEEVKEDITIFFEDTFLDITLLDNRRVFIKYNDYLFKFFVDENYTIFNIKLDFDDTIIKELFLFNEVSKRFMNIKINTNFQNEFINIMDNIYNKNKNCCLVCGTKNEIKYYKIFDSNLCNNKTCFNYIFCSPRYRNNINEDEKKYITPFLVSFIMSLYSTKRNLEIFPDFIPDQLVKESFDSFLLKVNMSYKVLIKKNKNNIVDFLLDNSISDDFTGIINWIIEVIKEKITDYVITNKKIELYINDPKLEEKTFLRNKSDITENEIISGYHGTKLVNLFNIFSQGLRNLSNTEKMSNGAVYGSGVYLTGDIHTAELYGVSNKIFNFTTYFDCDFFKPDKTNPHFVIQDDMKIIIRKITLIYN